MDIRSAAARTSSHTIGSKNGKEAFYNSIDTSGTSQISKLDTNKQRGEFLPQPQKL